MYKDNCWITVSISYINTLLFYFFNILARMTFFKCKSSSSFCFIYFCVFDIGIHGENSFFYEIIGEFIILFHINEHMYYTILTYYSNYLTYTKLICLTQLSHLLSQLNLPRHNLIAKHTSLAFQKLIWICNLKPFISSKPQI